jgi:hypothetical protein
MPWDKRLWLQPHQTDFTIAGFTRTRRRGQLSRRMDTAAIVSRRWHVAAARHDQVRLFGLRRCHLAQSQLPIIGLL